MNSKNLILIVLLLIASTLYTKDAYSGEEFKIGYNTYGNPSSYLYPISTDKWHYIVWCKGVDDVGKLYIDGKPVIENIYLKKAFNWTRLYLGTSRYTSFGDYFKGWLDEIKISNIVRTEEEILSYYNSNETFSIDKNTISLWHLDETNGNTFANSVNGLNAGKLYGNSIFTTGKFGNSIYFDGINSYADCNYNMPESDVTIEFWMKTDGYYLNKEGRGGTIIQPYGLYSGNIFLVSDTSTTISNCRLNGSLTNGLVAYYPFCGNANDESGNGNNGTVAGATLTEDRFGNLNSAYNFNGKDNMIEVPANTQFDFQNFTISAWVNTKELTKWQNIIAKSNWDNGANETFALAIRDSLIQMSIKNNSNCIAGRGWKRNTKKKPDEFDGKWQNIISTYDGAISKIFINGELYSLLNIDDKMDICSGGKIRIGAWWKYETEFFNGQIDDIGIWNRVLSEQEIGELTGQELISKNCPSLSSSLINGLVAYYPFCGNANDESGNGNNGTAIGADLTTDRFGNENNAFQFSGNENSFISVPSSPSLDITGEQLTISMWVFQENANSDLNWKGITKGGWDFGSGYELLYRNSYLGDSGSIQLSGNMGGLQADHVNINGNHGRWIHVVGTFNKGSGSVYLNGKLINSMFRGKSFSKFISNESPLLIGIRDAANKFVGYVNGKLDDIGIWNRVLSDQEIKELYGINSLVEKCPEINGSLTNGLVAYYPFCGNANDESGNGLNGTVNGATLTSDRFGDQNSAYSFTTGQDIVIPDTKTQNIFPMTISLWYNIDSINKGDNSNIFSKYYPAQWNGYLIHVVNNAVDGDSGIVTYPWYIRNSQNKLLGLYGEKPFYQSNVEVNKWYNYVYKVDETGGKIYVNGKLVDTHVWTGESGKCSNADLWKIGGKYDHWFHGKIDDIGIWNRVLSEDEINQLYSNCKFNTTIAPSTVFVNKGSDVLFGVTSNENNLSYQWQTNPSDIGWLNVPSNSKYSGSLSDELTIKDVKLSNHLQPFRVLASSETCTEISNTAYISLNDTCINVVDEVNNISVTDTLIITVNLTGISSTITNTIKVYPNPTKDYITINYGNYESLSGYKINITNSIGQVVYSSPITEQYSTINLSELGGIGLYFVNILNQQNNIIDSRKLLLKN